MSWQLNTPRNFAWICILWFYLVFKNIEYCTVAAVLNNYCFLVKIQMHERSCKQLGKGCVGHLELYCFRICNLCLRLDLASVKVTYTREYRTWLPSVSGWLWIHQAEKILLVWISYEGHGQIPVQPSQKHIACKQLLKLYDIQCVRNKCVLLDCKKNKKHPVMWGLLSDVGLYLLRSVHPPQRQKEIPKD